MGRQGSKFGWHSGVLTVKDAKVQRDLYVQDDIVFSDVSAGVLGVTGGIDMTGTTSAVGIDMNGATMATAELRLQNAATVDNSTDGTVLCTEPVWNFRATTSLIHSYDASNYLTSTVASNGVCKLATTGSADSFEIETADGKIILDAATDIDLDPAGADIHLLGAGAGKITLAATSVTLYGGDTAADSLVLRGSSAAATEAITILDGTSVTVLGTTVALSGAVTTDNSITCTMGDGEVLAINATDASGGAVAPLVYTSNMAIAGSTGGRALFQTLPTAQLGGWANAVKGYLDFAVTAQAGGLAGLGSAICAELRMPNGAVTGHLFPLEIEWVGQANTAFSTVGTGAASGFMWLKANGTVTDFDSDGVFMTVQGLTAGSGKLLATNKQTLRCDVDYGTLRYMFLSSTADSLGFTGSVTSGINFSSATLAPGTSGGDSSRAIEIGSRTTELTLAFAGGVAAENFEPIQMKVDVTGTNPASVSKINMLYQQLTHDTTDMANLRLKCADFTITADKNCQDVYAYQGEINGGAGTPTISGEVATMGLVLDAGAGAVTNSSWRGLNVTLRGAGTPASSQCIFTNVETGTVDCGLQIQAASGATLNHAIRIGNASYAESMTHLFAFPAEGTAPVADAGSTAGNDPVKISITVGGTQYYLVAAKDWT